RGWLRAGSRRFRHIAAPTSVRPRQENLETIHQHNVVAERHGLLAELRAEISSGEPAGHHTSLEEWLDRAAPAARTWPGSAAAQPPPPAARARPQRRRPPHKKSPPQS